MALLKDIDHGLGKLRNEVIANLRCATKRTLGSVGWQVNLEWDSHAVATKAVNRNLFLIAGERHTQNLCIFS
jgi:hypothetical protein